MSEERRVLCRKVIRSISQLLYEECADIIDEESHRRRVWTRKWLMRRANSGASSTIIREIYEEDPSEFRCVMRMTTEQFDNLLEKVSPLIQKADTIMREALPARVKLEITLAYLASGTNFTMLSIFFRVSKSAISSFIPEVCKAISKCLQEYLNVSVYL